MENASAGKDIPEKKRFSSCQNGFLKLHYLSKPVKRKFYMKRPLLYLLSVFLPGVLAGCTLFRQEGPPPVTPPYRLPGSAGKQALTPELLQAKMVDMLSMGIVTNNLAGRRFQKIRNPEGDREKQLLSSVSEKLAATGLIQLSTSPRDPYFTSRISRKSWQVTLEETFPRRTLLKKEILFQEK